MRDKWEQIRGFPDYLISDQGRVMNERTDRIKTLQRNKEGIIYVSIQASGKQSTRSVAVLVADHFLGAPAEERYDTVIHLNGEKDDCRVENLLWRPRPFAIEFHKQFQNPPAITKPVRIRETGEVFSSLRELSTTLGLIEKYVIASIADPSQETRVWPFNYIVEMA